MRPTIGNIGKMRVRFIEFELDGKDETLQESLKTIATVVNPPRRSPAALGPVSMKTDDAKKKAPDAEPPAQDAFQFDPPDTTEEETTPSSEQPRPRGPRTYTSPTVIALPEAAGKRPIDEYIASYRCETLRDKYLLALGYLSEIGIQEATADHVYTCFRKLEWGIQKDFAQPLRALRRSQHVERNSKPGLFVLNHVGHDAIRELRAKA